MAVWAGGVLLAWLRGLAAVRVIGPGWFTHVGGDETQARMSYAGS
ncbi:hypothetical protein ACVGXN_09855 [Enterobacter hormaechei]